MRNLAFNLQPSLLGPEPPFAYAFMNEWPWLWRITDALDCTVGTAKTRAGARLAVRALYRHALSDAA